MHIMAGYNSTYRIDIDDLVCILYFACIINVCLSGGSIIVHN